MTDSSGRRSISTILAALLAVPLVTMAVVMPLMALTRGGGMSEGAGLHMLVPLIPLTLLGGLAYLLYTHGSGRGGRQSHGTDELRAAYARGDLSDEAFKRRRDRLQSQSNDASEDDA